MLRKGYLQQQIEGLALAMQRLLGLGGMDRAEMLREMDVSCRDLTGLELETLLALGDDSLLAMFSAGDKTRCASNAFVAASLLAARAERDPPLARRAHRKALLLYAHAMSLESALHTEAFAERFDTIRAAVPDGETTPLIQRKLAAAYEAMGAFSRAEDQWYALRDAETTEAEALAHDFYDRLLARPDAEIEAGGLTRDEIVEALAELPERRV